MHRIIRNKETCLFLCGDESWSADWTAARNFAFTKDMIETAANLPQDRLEGVVIFNDMPSIEDVVLPLFHI